MTASIVVLTEEPSARIVIDHLCKLQLKCSVQILEHQGKNDLERSIARKINGWKARAPHFIITRDLDRGSREAVKTRLLALVPEHSRRRTKIRLVIPELEAWYLGDPTALVAAGLISQKAAQGIKSAARYRNLCTLQNAKMEFKKLVGNIGQISAAAQIAPWLDPSRNNSVNFHSFLSALKWAENSLQLSI